MDSVPPEILGAIFELVEDVISLRACALVTPSFVAPSQRSIFRSLRVPPRGAETSDSRILAALEAHLAAYPHLSSYVQDFTFFIPDLAHEGLALASILGSLTNITRLVIYGSKERTRAAIYKGTWSRMPVVLQTLLDDVSQRSLQRLHLIGIEGVPPSFIFRSPVLLLYNTTIDVQEVDASRSMSVIRLRYLSVPKDGDHPICSPLLNTLERTGSLERLRIWFDDERAENHSRLLSAVARTLRHLDIEGTALHPSLLLPHMPHVRTLQLSFGITRHRAFNTQFPSITFAQLASALPHVELLVFHVNASLRPQDHVLAWPTEPPIHTVHFPHLRRVECRLHSTRDEDILIKHFRAAMEGLMPQIKDTDLLEFRGAGSAGSPAEPCTAFVFCGFNFYVRGILDTLFIICNMMTPKLYADSEAQIVMQWIES
ncbi:hypothetical protein C8J57DRAFT_1518728 [Mycena rebaudengoi]|nr:hypothetical protein C8J57DRAFT_1518728 [Mycena rebaudengoi]